MSVGLLLAPCLQNSHAPLAVVRLKAEAAVGSLDALQNLLATEGHMSETSQGPRVHPALVEARQQRITLARLLTALRIPTGETETGRTQHRGAVRGVYPIAGGAS